MRFSKFILAFTTGIALLSPGPISSQETWPVFTPDPAWIAQLNERFGGRSGSFHDESYKGHLQDYTALGDYFNYGKSPKDYRTFGYMVVDDAGVPQVLDGKGELFWNPVTVGQFALTRYGQIIAGETALRDQFDAAIERLIEIQQPNGGFPYPAMQSNNFILPDGWVSAMAQGVALSAFVRSLGLKDDPRVRQAAALSFDNLMMPVEEGGTKDTMADLHPSLSEYVFFPEYPTNPEAYTLNGFMFALMGIYDWSQVESPQQEQAKAAFEAGIATLERILPYYDIDGLSTYDLAHLVLDFYPQPHPFYMGVHVYQLHALASITGSGILADYRKRWGDKVDAMNALLKFTVMKTDRLSPQKVGTPVRITLDSAGGTGSTKRYKVMYRLDGEWVTLQDYTTENEFVWTPEEAGEYVLGFFVRADDSDQSYDNYRHIPFVITP